MTGIYVGTSPIKSIYVGTTPVKEVYVGTTKVRPSYPKESIVIKIKADSSGNLGIPVAGESTSAGTSAYNWKVSYDGGAETTYSGQGSFSNTPLIIATGLAANSEHTVIIKPVVEDYGWARAFGFYRSGIANLLTEIVYDGSYMGYATSATATGNYFRADQYAVCTLITSVPEEVLPDTVTSIGTYFRRNQYSSCTSLTAAPVEVLPDSVTSIAADYRNGQYSGCTSLTEVKGWKDLSIGGTRYRSYMFYLCTASKTVKVLSNVGYAAANNYALESGYVAQVQVPNTYLSNFVNATTRPRVSIDDSKFVGY